MDKIGSRGLSTGPSFPAATPIFLCWLATSFVGESSYSIATSGIFVSHHGQSLPRVSQQKKQFQAYVLLHRPATRKKR